MSVVNLAKMFFMIMDILMNEDDNYIIAGNEIIAECTGFSVSYVLQLTPLFLKKTLTCLHKSYPVRLKGIYCTNTPKVFETVFNLGKTFMPAKLKNRMYLFSKSHANKLHTYVPQCDLPEELGGNNGSVKDLTVEWKQKVESYREWFLEDSRYGSNEKLRVDTSQKHCKIL
ncbi:hypothetical protein ILUMI_24544 [Ignelater luminosus]|uniref:CRAL-TRIO domain-containing protein n=1 Tax=Ignelater luminosus TaxID=2038154 RepID=A0A8K0CCC4_IGNLU|nr:hypothetical protein ILUMI_24544 [Ignelater luminosus]